MSKYKKEDLIKYIFDEKLNYESIGKIYNISGAAIKKAALRFGIELPQKRKINPKETFNKGVSKYEKGICLNCGKEFTKYPSKHNLFCDNKCQGEYKHKMAYKKIIDGDESIMRANYSPSPFRDIILEEQGGVCAICGNPPIWNDKPLVLIVDHIDGNASNNRRDNLRCICPNCDSQLDTYKSKNKNGARSYYRYNKHDKDIIM